MISERNSWHFSRYKARRCNICALLPVYLPDGTNGSQIYYMDGSVEQSVARVSWVLEDWLSHWHSSKPLLQRQSRRLLEQLGRPQQKRLPLLFAPDFALMPVKARQPQSHSHAADGYVVYNLIATIAKNKEGPGCIIWLKNGQELLALDSLRTLQTNLQMMAQLTKAMKDAELPS